eukprot:6173898-Pleurochrysis_carterae.AAC.4
MGSARARGHHSQQRERAGADIKAEPIWREFRDGAEIGLRSFLVVSHLRVHVVGVTVADGAWRQEAAVTARISHLHTLGPPLG